MLSIKADRKPDPASGRMLDDYWGPSVKLLGDMKFLDRLRLYDKDNIPPAVMQKIRQKSVAHYIKIQWRKCSTVTFKYI